MISCTFFGHKECSEQIKSVLRSQIEELIQQNHVDLFYVGNQGRFDAFVRGVLRELSVQYPHIQYAVVLPYMPKASESPEDYQDTMLPEGIEQIPPRFAIAWRNQWMLKQAEYIVCYVTHSWGGAAKFVEKARRQNKKVINLAEVFESDNGCPPDLL